MTPRILTKALSLGKSVSIHHYILLLHIIPCWECFDETFWERGCFVCLNITTTVGLTERFLNSRSGQSSSVVPSDACTLRNEKTKQ